MKARPPPAAGAHKKKIRRKLVKIQIGKRILPVILGLLLALTSLAAFAGCGEEKDAYTVVYHLNYTGAERAERETSVPAGAKAVAWQPVRDGYALNGWYTDAACDNEYDFDSAVRSDLDLYAGWQVQDTYTVTFDYNYGSGDTEEIYVKDGETIDTKLVPEISRLGRTFNGWYTEAACTNEWNMETDTVESNMTLYAGYTVDGSVPRDDNGDIVYENVVVNAWFAADFGTFSVFQQLANEFNAEYAGQISVNVTKTLGSQGAFSLRYQQTPGKSENEDTYYSAEQVYDLAGIELGEEDWYEQAARDSYVEGELTSVPIVAGVPFFVYNKSLMKEYNGDKLPSNFKELSDLLKEAYEGEIGSNPDFIGAFAPYQSWTWREAPSYAAFVQNGADYYEYDNGYVNRWDDPAVFENAVKAMQNTYDLFGLNGACHGGEASEDQGGAITKVRNGDALIGMVTYPENARDIASNSSTLGVLPLSGLFTDSAGEQAGQIPVHTIGFAFYRATDVSLTELAAAAVFTDYVSRNSYKFAESGWYPVRQSVVESDTFQKSTNSTVQTLLQVGEPENFRSLDGSRRGKAIVNVNAAGSILIPALNSDGTALRDYVSDLNGLIKGDLY